MEYRLKVLIKFRAQFPDLIIDSGFGSFLSQNYGKKPETLGTKGDIISHSKDAEKNHPHHLQYLTSSDLNNDRHGNKKTSKFQKHLWRYLSLNGKKQTYF